MRTVGMADRRKGDHVRGGTEGDMEKGERKGERGGGGCRIILEISVFVTS